jgi:hypothetical protein
MNKKLGRWFLTIVMCSICLVGCAGLAPSMDYWATDNAGVSTRPFWKEGAHCPKDFLRKGEQKTFKYVSPIENDKLMRSWGPDIERKHGFLQVVKIDYPKAENALVMPVGKVTIYYFDSYKYLQEAITMTGAHDVP